MNNSNNPIFTIITSDGYYLAFNNFSQIAYSIESLIEADEIIIQKMPSVEMAWRYLEAHNVFRQLRYGYTQSPDFRIYNLPPIDEFPYGVKGSIIPSERNNIVDFNYSYEVLCSDNRYFILSCLRDVSKVVADFKDVEQIRIYRQISNNVCFRHILAYDAAFQILMGRELLLLTPPEKSQTSWGVQGSKLEEEHIGFSKDLLPINR